MFFRGPLLRKGIGVVVFAVVDRRLVGESIRSLKIMFFLYLDHRMGGYILRE